MREAVAHEIDTLLEKLFKHGNSEVVIEKFYSISCVSVSQTVSFAAYS